MKFVELFAGIGGFRNGLGDGFTCIYANEFDKYARSVYRYHYGDIDGRDIRDVPPDEIPDADLWTFGAPCQDFSVAGKRRGLEGERGNLFLYTLSLLEIKRPRYFLAENVPGLLSIDGGKAFAHIIGKIAEMGYVCQWICLNSKDFGVPQNRERVFLVGNLGGQPRPEILSFGEGDGDTPESGGEREGGVLCVGLDSSYHKGADGKRTMIQEAPTIRSETNTADVHFIPEQKKVGNIYPSGGEQGDVFDPSGISRTLKSGETANPDHGGIGSSNSPKIIAGSSIRRLTPMECERLQGFQDSWTARGIDDSGNEVEISDSQRYRQCGNAITCPVISHFGRELRRLR